MRKTIKACLIVMGILVACGSIAMVAFGTEKYETNSYVVVADFTEISMKTDTADISLALSEDDECKVVCYEPEKVRHIVTNEGYTLSVNVIDERQWYERIGIYAHSPKITVYLPNSSYQSLVIREDTGDIEIPGDFHFESMDISTSTGNIRNLASADTSVKIKATTGSIHVEGITADTLDLCASTGKVIVTDATCASDIKIAVTTGEIDVTDVQCKNILSDGDTGNVRLENVIATEKISIERSTGDVKFNSCDAAEIFVETDTGDVTGNLLTDKVFFAETDTGRIDVPRTTSGGKCEISTDTGDIKIAIDEKQ